MSAQHYAALESDADSGGHLHLDVEAARLPQRPTQPPLLRLLARDAPRSERDPELAVASSIAMHPVTGTFADPAHESAFAVQLFRLAFPIHLLVLALTLAFVVSRMGLVSSSELLALLGMIALLSASVGLVGLALLHQMHDWARAQRLGLWTWTILLVAVKVAEMGSYMTAPAAVCEQNRRDHSALIMAEAIGLVNGSYGMPFVQKGALVGCICLTLLTATAICQDSAAAHRAGSLILGATIAHLTELYLRHSYAEKRRTHEDKRRLEERNEQLQAEKERLLYDMQRPGRPLDDSVERSAIRHGLQAAPSQSYPPADGSSKTAAPSEFLEILPASAAGSEITSSGPFTAVSSLWSGWSAKWSDPGENQAAKLSALLRHAPRGAVFAPMQEVQEAIRTQKSRIAEAEASKAKRRARDHGKAYGKLVWLLLRRAQKRPGIISLIPRDALRIVVAFVRAGETARLDHLYSSRVAAGGSSWRSHPGLDQSVQKEW